MDERERARARRRRKRRQQKPSVKWPRVILAIVVEMCIRDRGKGVEEMEGQAGWHGKAPSEEQGVAFVNEIMGVQ